MITHQSLDGKDALPPFGRVARFYLEHGWPPLPLPAGEKTPPPNGHTGESGVDADLDQIKAWAAENGHRNIGVRMPANVIGIDVDNYADKTGGADLAVLEGKLGALPPASISTSREDGVSGIRFFTVPTGLRWQGKLGNSIEIIQRKHRYAVVEPSIHPSGRQYRWLDADWQPADVPTVVQLPEMPPAWVEYLTDGEVDTGPAPKKATVTPLDTYAVLTPGTPCKAMAKALDGYSARIASMAHHDAMIITQQALVRLGELGHQGAGEAVEQLRAQFGADVAGVRGGAENGEFQRALSGAVAIALGSPTAPADRRCCGYDLPPVTVLEPPPKAAQELEAFWDSMEVLAHIREHALARMASPWGVFGVSLLRMLAVIPPHVVLPPTIGNRASLNSIVALVASSGLGKGASESAAEDVIEYLDRTVFSVPIGSGAGITHQYAYRASKAQIDNGQADEAGLVHIRSSVLFSAPEVDTLTAISQRQGETLLSQLRSAWSGESLGFANADAQRRIILKKHRYRLGLVIGVQPEKAGPLLIDAPAGTPQRLIWLPAYEPNLSAWPGPELAQHVIKPQVFHAGAGGFHVLIIPDSVKQFLRERHVARNRLEIAALDAHRDMARLKVAQALTFLDSRQTMTERDWELAGMVMAKSDATRAEVQATLARTTQEENTRRALSDGRREVIKGQVVRGDELERVSEAILRKLAREADWVRGKIAREAVPRPLRHHFDEVIGKLEELGQIEVEDVPGTGQTGIRLRLKGAR
jgi:hypothetical protein